MALTNAEEVAARLTCNEVCDGRTVEVSGPEGHGSAEVEEAILKGTVEGMRRQGRMNCGEVGITPAQEIMEVNQEWFGRKEEFYDNISGEWVDPEMVKQARKEEMMEVEKNRVYEKVDVAECYEKTGKAPIGTRWVDVNKGDSVHPEYRSRLVAQEVNTSRREDLRCRS